MHNVECTCILERQRKNVRCNDLLYIFYFFILNGLHMVSWLALGNHALYTLLYAVFILFISFFSVGEKALCNRTKDDYNVLEFALAYSSSFSLIVSIISLKLFNPDSKFSIISLAKISGSGRLSKSVRLLSLIQKMSRLVLSLAMMSS